MYIKFVPANVCVNFVFIAIAAYLNELPVVDRQQFGE